MDIAHVCWRVQYDTFEVFTGTADLLGFVRVFLLIIFVYFYCFLVVVFFFGGGEAAIGYLMQIFYISLHFLYDKGLLLPSSLQSAFKRLSVPFVLDAGLFYKN